MPQPQLALDFANTDFDVLPLHFARCPITHSQRELPALRYRRLLALKQQQHQQQLSLLSSAIASANANASAGAAAPSQDAPHVQFRDRLDSACAVDIPSPQGLAIDSSSDGPMWPMRDSSSSLLDSTLDLSAPSLDSSLLSPLDMTVASSFSIDFDTPASLPKSMSSTSLRHALPRVPSAHNLKNHPLLQHLHNPPPRRASTSTVESPVSPALSFLLSLSVPATPPLPSHPSHVGPYTLHDSLNQSEHSTVYRATRPDSPNVHYAVKLLPRSPVGYRELQLWSKLHHPHILPLLEHLETPSHIALVSPLASLSLLAYLDSQPDNRLDVGTARTLFIQLLDAMEYLHTVARVVHRDIKLENILLRTNPDGSLHAYLADFGLAECMAEPPSAPPDTLVFCTGSLHYCAPEEFQRAFTPSPSSDIWSLGCVLYAMLVGCLPFEDAYTPRLQRKIAKGDVRLDDVPDEAGAREVLGRMLCVGVERRVDVEGCRQLRWVRGDD